MALEEIDAFCDVCGHHFRQLPQRSFLGFQKLKCTNCGAELVYPLTRGYRSFYSVATAFTVLAMISSLWMGRFAAPGLIGFAMIVGLVKDRYIRRELAAGEKARAAIGTGEPRA